MSDPVDLPLSSEPRVSVLIPVRGGARTIGLLSACLRQLAGCAGEAQFETLLLLNQVSGEVKSWVERSVRGARVLTSDVNLGLAGGLLMLRRPARGELLISIHQDTEVEAGWLRALVDTADERPEAGAIGSLVLEPDGVTLQAAGWVMCADGATFPPWWGSDVPTREAFEGRDAHGVDYSPSSSLLLRAEVWDAFGGPDERLYPAFYVDVDLAMGVRSVGRSVLVEPRSVARHHRGSATTQRFRSFLAERNQKLFLAKWSKLLDRFLPRSALDEGVGRLVQRAADEAERYREAWSAPPAEASQRVVAGPPPLDQRELERRCVEHERDVRNEYVTSLESRVAALEHELTSRPSPSTATSTGPPGHQPP
jgi:GT2 family glycosyltransferase